MAKLFTGSNRIRLVARMLAILPAIPSDPDKPELESVAIAGAVLRAFDPLSHRWFEEFADCWPTRDSLDPPPVHDESLHHSLEEAFEDARARRRGDRLRDHTSDAVG